MDVRPFFEIFGKAFGVFAFRRIIHLFVNSFVEFAEHSRPIRVFIQARKLFGEFRYFPQNLDVALDNCDQIRTLNFDGDFFAGEKFGAINLSQRRSGNRFDIEFLINLVDFSA